MANALSSSRMALASARAFPARRSALPAATGGSGGGGAFGARMPASRLLGERRLFAYPPGNGNGRGAHTSTAAIPKDRGAKAAPASAAAAAKAKHAEQPTAAVPTELAFAPFDEVKKPLEELRESEGHDVSLAREEGFTSQLEEAVNNQINVELTIRHVATRRARSRSARSRRLAPSSRAHRSPRGPEAPPDGSLGRVPQPHLPQHVRVL